MPSHTPAERDPYDLSGLRVALYLRVSRDSSGEEKSTKDQKAEALAWAERAGVRIVSTYEDVSLSASEFATKERPGYKQLLTLIAAGDVDLVWFWALNRATRQAREYLDLAELCQVRGIRWVVGGKVYDLDDDDDTIGLDLHNIMDRRYSRKLSRDVKRGKMYGAKAGKPAGRLAYGYRPIYDTTVIPPRYLRADPDVFDGDSNAIENSPAWVIREIFARVAAGRSLRSICHDLEDRGVPGPRGPRWHPFTLRHLAGNPAYIGKRVYQVGRHSPTGNRADPRARRAAILNDTETTWPALVSEELFWTVQRILEGRLGPGGRKPGEGGSVAGKGGPGTGNAKHLLSGIARCGVCGEAMFYKMQPNRPTTYGCIGRHFCVSIPEAVADEYVSVLIVRRLERGDLFADLAAKGSDAARQARADAEQLRADLADWRAKAKASEISASFYAEIEQDRLQRIAEAERREQAAVLPPGLRGNTGPGAGQRWLQLDVPARRLIIRSLADVSVGKASRGKWTPVADRVTVDFRSQDSNGGG
jgi:site-specific DNA recombinase